MDVANIKRKYRKSGPKVNINIKVSEEVSVWLREMNYSPTGIFNEALKELGCPEMIGQGCKDVNDMAPVITEDQSE